MSPGGFLSQVGPFIRLRAVACTALVVRHLEYLAMDQAQLWLKSIEHGAVALLNIRIQAQKVHMKGLKF